MPEPYNWKAELKASPDRDIARGIIKLVPTGTPAEWCSTMVIIQKHCQSPFQLTFQVPPNNKKTVLDAVDGYHAIELNEESQPSTTSITEWGRYMYSHMPQGFSAAGDAYIQRYDEVTNDMPRKVKCVDVI